MPKSYRPDSAAFRLLDGNWEFELTQALATDKSQGRIACPFIKEDALRRLLRDTRPARLQVITRFNLDECVQGVQDLGALRLLLGLGAQVRGVKNLHTKLYVFGASRAIVTSANLTGGGLTRNHEFGFISGDPAIVDGRSQYFDQLWARAGKDLPPELLAQWQEQVARHHLAVAPQDPGPRLGDTGELVSAAAGLSGVVGRGAATRQAYVKFQGESSNRADPAMLAREAIRQLGCHWAVAYPKGKRPRGVRDGALMFISRLTKNPNDIRIFGRAIGRRHEPGRDDATAAEIELRDWKVKWPHYVRLDAPEFIDVTLGDGISMNELTEELQANAFAATQRNAAQGNGNTQPRRAYLQQAAVQLSPEGEAWITKRLEAAFELHGRVASAVLAGLDQPNREFAAAATAGELY